MPLNTPGEAGKRHSQQQGGLDLHRNLSFPPAPFDRTAEQLYSPNRLSLYRTFI